MSPNSIVPAQGGSPRTNPKGGLARPVPGSVLLHQAGSMELSSGKALRQECWDSMGEGVRTRLLERAGNRVEWWAAEDSSSGDGRAKAVVFGDQGLSVAEPRLNAEHRPVYSLSCYVLDPASFRHMLIDHRPQPTSPYAGVTSSPAEPQVQDLGLTQAAMGLLGNLPPKAQELLQAPFVGGQELLRCDWHYEGHAHHLTMFMIYLAGPKDVTVASGTKLIPAGHNDATAHWSLSVHRASVVKRIGK